MIAWGAHNLLWASAAMLLVLVIRRPVATVFGAGVGYGLWLIPALRLIAPPAEWIAGLFGTTAPALPGLLLALEPVEMAPLAAASTGPAVLLAIWAAGAMCFVGWQALAYRAFLARLSGAMRSVGCHDGLPLVESTAVDGPLALGLLDRRIVVPADFHVRYTPAEQALALAHEAYHHRRGDIFANHIALLMLAVNWFSPVAWLAFRAFRADQELSCDAAIAAGAPADLRVDYARALIKSASRPGLIAACPLNHADQLKRRLKMLNHHRKDRRRLWAGSAMTGALVLTSMAFGAPGQAQNKAEPKEQRRVTVIERHDSTHETHAPGERRAFTMRPGEQGNVIYRNMDPETAARIERCRDGNSLIDVDEGEGSERTRIVLCSDGDSANRLQALLRARERMVGRTELSEQTKQRLLAHIDAAIARARAVN